MYDIDLIYSWTPREFKNLIKGAQLRRVDDYELTATSAIFNAKVKSKKKVKLKDIYDADKARRAVEYGREKKDEVKYMERWNNAQRALKRLGSKSVKEGG